MKAQRLPYKITTVFAAAFAACLAFCCKKPYQPAPIVVSNNYLVVDGVINTGVHGATTIKLNRARSINDSNYTPIPENGATILIENSAGNAYQLHPTEAGVYMSDSLTLDIAQTYRLNITTTDGKQYLSDFVKVKQSPPIDSINWVQDNGVHIYANTHDDANQTTYYRWDFTETIQHDAKYQISWGLDSTGHHIISITNVDYPRYTYHCWTDSNNTNVILGTSLALTKDVISRQPIQFIPDNGIKIRIRYSIIVRQYALTQEAYQYWQIIQKNTQNIGTLFDLQPSQLHGNITCVSDPTVPVIGWVGAGSVQQQRIFIDHLDLQHWAPVPPDTYCPVVVIDQHADFSYYDYPDESFGPYYFISGGALAITKKVCLDCRSDGGTNIKPKFWVP